ncbi:DUF885 domain-containing protein [Natronoglycomyces albus]|uniref:DUF885 domain-containing protein n=1 Tax=Natronoglycomyces albus TaxID=2811108 RepID=A0A895XJ79_9ACTN|nr:DUF885 domain-containing protein [Natronoglycomyces albus]QSB05037.1 DUF885 domain-containing protein [Natronoglycomyces albus]
MSKIDDIANDFVEEFIANSPTTATYLGHPGHDDKWDDLSPAGYAKDIDLHRRVLAEIKAVEPADSSERAAKEAMIERFELKIERYDAGDTHLDLNVLTSSVHGMRQIFDLMPHEGEEAARNIARRLQAFPTAVDQYIETLRGEAKAGRVAAHRQVTEVARHCDNWNGANGDNFWENLTTKTVTVDGEPATGALAAELAEGAQAAHRATAAFATFLRDELAGQAPQEDAIGEDAYSRASRYFIGAKVDLRETYEWGWAELARIEEEMREVADRIKPGATVDEAVEYLDSSDDDRMTDKYAFRDWMQELSDRTVEEMQEYFDIPEPVRKLECMLAPAEDGAIYYTGPSEDFSRPGRMWWSVPSSQTHFSKWREMTTVFHEGIPGHHLQIGQTAYRSELLNRYQRQLLFCSGHAEGWALYSERLMDELGYYKDYPAGKLGMLDGQAMRAARVIVDIGLHCQFEIPEDNPFGFRPGEKWDHARVWEFMRAHCRVPDPMLDFEVNRYLGWPGQAPSYKVGERLWKQARDDYKERKGADFSLTQFHSDSLNLGPMGLDPFAAALKRL